MRSISRVGFAAALLFEQPEVFMSGSIAKSMSDLQLFFAAIDYLNVLLEKLRRQRCAMVAKHVEQKERKRARQRPSEWETFQGHLISHLTLAYILARRLKLSTDPAPLLEALFPDDDEHEDEDFNILTAMKTLMCLKLDAEAQDEAADSSSLWRNTRWITASSKVTSDDIRTARFRGKSIGRRQRNGKAPEYYLPDIKREFPAKAAGLLKNISSADS